MADELEVVRTQELVLPNLVLDEKTVNTIGDLLSIGVVDNILQQRQANGSGIKRNAQSTSDRKALLGRPLKSLIDEPSRHRFIQGNRGSFRFGLTGTGTVRKLRIRPATDELRAISRHVQEKGYVGWFGIHRETAAAVLDVVSRWIVEKFDAAEGGQR